MSATRTTGILSTDVPAPALTGRYCSAPVTGSARRKTRVVRVGQIAVGGDNPIRLQSMTISDTMDTMATVREAIQLFEAGSEIVRITAPSWKDAENLKLIKAEIKRAGYDFPICADIHFSPKAAMFAVEHVEKVRINPGNFVDEKRFKIREYTDHEYAAELERLAEAFSPLVKRAKELGRALRIGTNHGSLSDRILNRYGDTPAGMVESAIEFIKIAEYNSFREIIISMKASNVQVMVQAYRMLVERMDLEGMDYPLHLGVTEAGDGQDGRLKSAAGIGSLLNDGLGDTIRVSLTEDPVFELPVARALAERFRDLPARVAASGLLGPVATKTGPAAVDRRYFEILNPYVYRRRSSAPCFPGSPLRSAGGPVRFALPVDFSENTQLDPIVLGGAAREGGDVFWLRGSDQGALAGWLATHRPALEGALIVLEPVGGTEPEADVLSLVNGVALELNADEPAAADALERVRRYAADGRTVFVTLFAKTDYILKNGDFLRQVQAAASGRIAFSLAEPSGQGDLLRRTRLLTVLLEDLAGATGVRSPILLRETFLDLDTGLYDAAFGLGGLLVDGIGDMLLLEFQAPVALAENLRLGLDILQALRLRMSKTEYISCPSCGRTLFDLQTTTSRIKARTGHLKGVKIAVMGCIVNGPGEMADADFGYVGAGPGKIHLYRGKDLVKPNVPAPDADNTLVELIKEHGMWAEPDSP